MRLLWDSGDPLLFINVAVCEPPMRVWWPITIYQCSSIWTSYQSLVTHYYLSMYQYVNRLCEFGDPLLFINVAVCVPPMRVWWSITIYQCTSMWTSYVSLVIHYYLSMWQYVSLLWEFGDPLLFINVAVCEPHMIVWWSITIYQCSSMWTSYESLVIHYYLSM